MANVTESSPQYRKALKVSFPADRWPATEVTDPDGSLRFVLKDGTEIHRIGILAEEYDYQTGRLVGHVGPRGRRIPRTLSQWFTGAAGASATTSPEEEAHGTWGARAAPTRNKFWAETGRLSAWLVGVACGG